MGKIYLLFYDTDHGEREEWNTFYTPVEAFETKELRKDRRKFLTGKYRELEFHEIDLDISTKDSVTTPLERFDDDEDI